MQLLHIERLCVRVQLNLEVSSVLAVKVGQSDRAVVGSYNGDSNKKF